MRQLIKLKAKLEIDEFGIEDLEIENSKKKNKWKLDGKSFWEIHSEVDNKELYSFIYGTGSDFIHGSWHEIMDFHLTRKGNQYSGFYYFEKCDCRAIVPLNSIVLESLQEFLTWDHCMDAAIANELNKMGKCNSEIYLTYESNFGEKMQ